VAPKITDLQLDVQKQAQQKRDLVFKDLEHLKSEVAAQIAELRSGTYQQKDSILQNLEKLEFDFSAQLSKLQSDAQTQKDLILQQLAESPTSESFLTEVQQKLQELTEQFKLLKSSHPQLFFTPDDYVKQGMRCSLRVAMKMRSPTTIKQLKFSLTI
jgi:cobalamin biosynthesis Co2+ chelatase CbiK